MTTHLEPGPAMSIDPAAAHPRFPVNKIGPSLLTIIQSAADGVIIVNAARQIVLVNRKAEQMFGYSARQLLDKSMDILLPPRLRAEQRRRMERLAAARTGARRARLGFKGIHSSGVEFPVSASISRIVVLGEMFLMALMRDLKAQIRHDGAQPIMMTSELRRLAASSHQAAEIEKRRFSRELYDDIGQRLSVLKLDLDWLEHSLPDDAGHLPGHVAQMRGMLDHVITMTKSMASALRPPLLDDFGLMPAVEWMADNFQRRTSIICRVEGKGMKAKLGDPLESAVFRVIQEALLNIERHAHASNAKVVLERAGGYLDVTIEDDGIGMPPESWNKPGCYGLIAMQERVFVLGGTISVQNMKPQGVAIHASIPIDSFPTQ